MRSIVRILGKRDWEGNMRAGGDGREGLDNMEVRDTLDGSFRSLVSSTGPVSFQRFILKVGYCYI